MMLNWIKRIFKRDETVTVIVGEYTYLNPKYLKEMSQRYGRDSTGRFIKGNKVSKNTPREKNGRFRKGEK